MTHTAPTLSPNDLALTTFAVQLDRGPRHGRLPAVRLYGELALQSARAVHRRLVA